MELKDLKAGDKVFISYGRHDYREVEIDKITPTGMIKINGQLFYPDGRERRKGYYGDHILAINDKSIERVKLLRREMEVSRMASYLIQINYRSLPDDMIENIYNKIKQWQDSQASQDKI